MAKNKTPARTPAPRPPSKPGANIGGMYLWSQRDFNNLMSQLSTIQATVTQLTSRLQAMQAAQAVQQASITSSLAKIATQETRQMSALDDLKTAVEQTQTVEQSAVVLIQGIAKQLNDALANNQAANNDPALAQLRDQLNSSAAELGAAVAAGTTSDPNAPQVTPQAAHR
jgi:chromosome segregation ATPase